MGPYCKFCDNRCFTPLGIIGGRIAPKWVFELYGDVSIIATCPKGQALEREQVGICHSEIPWEQDGEVSEETHLRQERDFYKRHMRGRNALLKAVKRAIPLLEAHACFSERMHREDCDHEEANVVAQLTQAFALSIEKKP